MSLSTCPRLDSQKVSLAQRKFKLKTVGLVSTIAPRHKRSTKGFGTVRDLKEWNDGIGTGEELGLKQIKVENEISSLQQVCQGPTPNNVGLKLTETKRGRRHLPPYTKENEQRREKEQAREANSAKARRERNESRRRDYNILTNTGKGGALPTNPADTVSAIQRAAQTRPW